MLACLNVHSNNPPDLSHPSIYPENLNKDLNDADDIVHIPIN